MTAIATQYKYIQLVIEGTTMKLVELVVSHLTYGWSPEELHFQYPHVSLSKVYSALSYYWDHKEELDRDIERRSQRVDALRESVGASAIVAMLKDKGLLS